jgi:hypothetical protein
MDYILSLQIALIGILVVFVTLAILNGLLEIPQLVVRLRNRNKQPVQEAPDQSILEGIPPQHLAVIAAAIASLGDSYRIKTIEVSRNQNWERCRYTEITTL